MKKICALALLLGLGMLVGCGDDTTKKGTTKTTTSTSTTGTSTGTPKDTK